MMQNKVIEKVNHFFSKHERHTYKKGEYLKTPDKQLEGVFCLQNGVVRCFAISKEGAELTINIFKPVSFFPVGWVINNASDNYTYQATTDVEVFIAPKDAVEKFMQDNPDVVYDLLKRIYRGLEGYFMRMESLLSGEPYFRTVVQLIIHTRRFGKKEGEQYKVNLTHSQLASLAGLSRETVTREIKKLEDKKLIQYEGKQLMVLDIAKLEEQMAS